MEDPKNWSFFEKDSTQLDTNIFAKAAMSPTHQCEFNYLGRRLLGGKNTHTHVKFSKYESKQMTKWLNPILDQIHSFEGNYFELNLTDLGKITVLAI